jgi:hypothetical protein
MRRWVVVLVVSGWAVQVQADRVHLDDGAVLEGNAEVGESEVVVHAPGGSLTLPRGAVVRVEQAETAITRFEERYAKLRDKDVAGRLKLADFCRDHGLSKREHKVLREIIGLSPNHAVARARLGYVKVTEGWITVAESNRRKGLVLREGRWVTPERAAKLDVLDLERRRLAIEQRQAEAELARAEREREAQPAPSVAPPAPPEPSRVLVYGGVFQPFPAVDPAYRSRLRCKDERCERRRKRPRRKPFIIPHVRDPRDYL